jgi:hypothetical protein
MDGAAGAPAAIKIAHQIHIRLRQRFTTGHRTEQGEAHDAGSLELLLMCPQRLDDLFSIHVRALPQAGSGPNCIISKRRVVAQCLEAGTQDKSQITNHSQHWTKRTTSNRMCASFPD